MPAVFFVLYSQKKVMTGGGEAGFSVIFPILIDVVGRGIKGYYGIANDYHFTSRSCNIS